MERIRSLDMFAPDIKMNINGKRAIGSSFGVLLSVAYLGLFACLAYLIIADFLDTSQPRISQGVNSTELPPLISFAEDKLFPILNFGHQTQGPLKLADIQKFVTVRFMKTFLQRDANTGAVQRRIRMLKVVPCADIFYTDKFKQFEGLTQVEKELMLSSAVCMDPGEEDLSLGQLKETDPFYQQVSLWVLPCSLPTGCASRQELAKITLASIIPKPILNLSDKKHPIRYVRLADEVMYLSTALTGRQTLNLLKTEIVDDAGFLQGKERAGIYSSIDSTSYSATDRDSSQLSCTPAQMMDNSCIPYWIQSFGTSPRKMVIKRQYKGMVETFSELGGTADMLFMIFCFPYSLYHSRILRERLVELIHGVKKPKKLRKATSVTPEQRASEEQQHLKLRQHYHTLVTEVDSWLNLAKITAEVQKVRAILQDHNFRRNGPMIEHLPDPEISQANHDLSSLPLNQNSAIFDSHNHVVPLARNLRPVQRPKQLTVGLKGASGVYRGAMQSLYLPREPAAKENKPDTEQRVGSIESSGRPSDVQGEGEAAVDSRNPPKFDW